MSTPQSDEMLDDNRLEQLIDDLKDTKEEGGIIG